MSETNSIESHPKEKWLFSVNVSRSGRFWAVERSRYAESLSEEREQ